MNERDVWLTATVMIKRFGEDAAIEAAMRADELFAEGDYAGASIWRQIKRNIELVNLSMTTGPLH